MLLFGPPGAGKGTVLILIVLDHLIMLLGRLQARPVLSRLNPYCIGSSNHAFYESYIVFPFGSLNPYCIGSSNHAKIPLQFSGSDGSSLNPYCIGSSNHAQMTEVLEETEEGLNPYCIGSSNHARHKTDGAKNLHKS